MGSVIAQQPMYLPSRSSAKGFTISSSSRGFSAICPAANWNGNDVTPSAMAKSALPHPISSAMMWLPIAPTSTPPSAGGKLRVWKPCS